MGTQAVSRFARIRSAAQNFFEEKGIESEETFARTRLQRFAHFWLLVFKSFSRNRCPVRASALAYTTLLALVPLLAIVVSVTTSMLKSGGKEPVRDLVDKLVSYAAPTLDLEVRAGDPDAVGGRERVVNQIFGFIQNINSGTLGVTSVLVLMFVGISLLRTIEMAFNDIWGVIHGRSLVKSIVYYWAAITLGPVILVGAILLTTGPHLTRTQEMLTSVPFVGTVILHILPFIILSVGFSAFYAFMPNTRVQFKAALVGGTVGGCLWQLNNLFSVVYVSRAITYTNVYGSLALFPLFLVGLYFSWLIMLFGAQVAYAFQNRRAYIQEKQAESVNQRGREFIALRVMTQVAANFLRGARPASAVQLSRSLGIPSQLVCKVLTTLVQSGLIVEVADGELAYSPGRPLNRITAYDVLCSMRAGHGLELSTKDDPLRLPVRAEFEKIVEAEREAGSSVTLETLAQGRLEATLAPTA